LAYGQPEKVMNMRMQVMKIFASAVLAVVAPLTAASQTIKTQISFPQPVSGIAADPISNRIYVVAPSFGGPSDTLSVIDGTKDTVIQNITIPTGAYLPAVNILTQRVYIASCNIFADPVPCFVTVVSEQKKKVIANIPITTTQGNGLQGITVDPVTDKIYVANASDNVIDIIDGRTNTLTGTISLDGDSPFGLTINPLNNRLYVPLGNNQVDVIDACKKTIMATTTFGSSTAFAAVNLATGHVFVTDSVFGPSTTGVLDKNGVLLASVPVGDTPFGLDVDPVTNRVFVASTALNNVTVINGANNTVASTVSGIQANFVAVNIATEKVYLSGDNGVTVITEK
jgi:YVTN family beta-propeller protein